MSGPGDPPLDEHPSPYAEEDARAFLRGAEGVFDFAVVDAATDELLGSVGFGLEGHGRAGFGYWTRKEARGRDVASRALRLLTRWAAREHGLARLQLIVEPENRASIRVAEKAGFQREALLRSYIELTGTRHDVYMYALLPEDL